MGSLRLKIYDATQHAEWQAALTCFAPNDDLYFSAQYHMVAAAPGGGEACCALVEGDGCALLLPYLRCAIRERPGRYDVQSAYGYGGPLALNPNPKFLDSAWRILVDRWRLDGIVAAFLRCHPLVGNASWVPPEWHVEYNRPTLAIDLRGGTDAAFAGADAAKHRREVARTARLGFDASELPEPGGALDQFIEIYEQTMQRRGAGEFYSFSRSYYVALFRELGERVSMFKVSHRASGEVASMGLALWGARWGHYHLSATCPVPGGVNGTHTLLQAMAEAAVCRGCEMVHLGGGRTTASDDALFRFKRWIGRHELAFYTAGKIIDPDLYSDLLRDWKARHVGTEPRWFLGYRQAAPPNPASASMT